MMAASTPTASMEARASSVPSSCCDPISFPVLPSTIHGRGSWIWQSIISNGTLLRNRVELDHLRTDTRRSEIGQDPREPAAGKTTTGRLVYDLHSHTHSVISPSIWILHD